MGVSVGVLGFAHGHVASYIGEWRRHPEFGISVVAGWDHDASRLGHAVGEYGIQGFDETEGVLTHPSVEAVIIAAETALHADLVVKAASMGKAVVLQKPMALTMGEADRIVEAVQSFGVPFTLAWQMRVDPQNIKIKQLIEGGSLGRLFSVRRRHGLGTHLWPGFSDSWHVAPAMNRDIWADDSAHPIDFINWLLGTPESVTAELASIFDPKVPNDNGIAVFRYPQGHLAEVSCCFTCAAAENTTEVYAEKGTIVQNFGDATSCNVLRQDGLPGLKWYTVEDKDWTLSDIASPANHGERIAGLAKPLAEFLMGARGPLATAEEGRSSLRMVLACYLSSRRGCRVFLSDEEIDQI